MSNRVRIHGSWMIPYYTSPNGNIVVIWDQFAFGEKCKVYHKVVYENAEGECSNPKFELVEVFVTFYEAMNYIKQMFDGVIYRGPEYAQLVCNNLEE